MRLFYSFVAGMWLLFGTSPAAVGQALDPGFAPSTLTSFGNGIRAMLRQPDGKVIISGGYQLLNGQASPGVARLNADGSPDLAFRAQAGSGPNSSITALALQADGKILLGAEYGLTGYNGAVVQNIVRLNADGSLDSSFGSGGTGWLGGEIHSIAVQADGNILVGGAVSATFNGQPTKGLVRLLPSGQPDATFNTGAGFAYSNGNNNAIVYKIIVQPDGNIVVVGGFETVAGQPRQAIARLLPSGGLDTSFTSPLGAYAFGTDVVRQPDGKLVVAGNTLTGVTTNNVGVLRLLANGTLDPAFAAGTCGGIVLGLTLRNDGSIVAAGSFNSFAGNGQANLVRLSNAGAVDATFAAGAGTPNGLLRVIELNNGQYLAGGFPTSSGGQIISGLSRLQPNGQPDTGFSTSFDYVSSVSLIPLVDGRVLLNNVPPGNFNGQTINSGYHRLNADGTYNAQLTFPPAISRPAGGTYYQDFWPQTDGSTYAAYQNSDTTMQVRHILATGAFDPAFTSVVLQFGTRNSFPFCCAGVSISPAPGGGLLVRGAFRRVNGQPRAYLARLQANGTLNTQFAPPVPSVWQVPTIGVGNNPGFRNAYGLTNGQTLVLWNDPTRSYLARLNADGTLDNTFSIGTGGGPNALFSILPLAAGGILINGDFTTFNGQAAPNGLLRLLPTGAPDPTFTAASPARNVAEQADGKLVLVAPGATSQIERLLRLTTTGSLDAGFQPVVIGNASVRAADATAYLQPGTNAILLSGNFTSVAGQPRFGLARLVNTALAVRGATAAQLAEVFPNPAHEQLSVRLPAAPTGPATLTDLQGRTVRRYPLAHASTDNLSLHGLAPGLYLLSVPTAAGTARQRLAVE